MVEPAHPAMAIGKVRHVGEIVAIVVAETRDQAREAAALIDIDYQELPAVGLAGGRPRGWRSAGLGRGRRQPVLRLGGGGPGGRGRRHRRRRPRGLDRRGEPAVGPQRDRAARRHRQLRPDDGRVHPLHHQPEPAPDQAAAGRFRARSPRAQAAHRGPRRRGRLRVEDSALRGRGGPHLDRRPAGQAGEVDVRPFGGLRFRYPGPRPHQHGHAGPRRGRQVRRAEGLHPGQPGRVPVHLRDLRAHLPVRHPVRGALHDPRHLRGGRGGVHEHRAGRRAAGGAGAARGHLPARAPGRQGRRRDRHRPGRHPAPQLHPRVPLPDPGRAPIRPGRLRRHPRPGARGVGLGRLRGAPERGGRPREAAGHRHLHLHRGVRHRALGGGRGRWARAPGCTR